MVLGKLGYGMHKSHPPVKKKTLTKDIRSESGLEKNNRGKASK